MKFHNYTPAQQSWGGGGRGGYTGLTLSVRPSVRPPVCRRHGFQSITQDYFGISISNSICMLFVAMGQSLLIFRDVTFKMTAWRPYWIFQFRDTDFSWLGISSPNFSSILLVCIERRLLIFSYVTFKMAAWWPYWIFQFTDFNFSLALNIKSKLQ